MIRIELNDSEAELVLTALINERKAKSEACAIVQRGMPSQYFHESDFGIPQIKELIKRIEDAPEVD